jgi:hypothetical protein
VPARGPCCLGREGERRSGREQSRAERDAGGKAGREVGVCPRAGRLAILKAEGGAPRGWPPRSDRARGGRPRRGGGGPRRAGRRAAGLRPGGRRFCHVSNDATAATAASPAPPAAATPRPLANGRVGGAGPAAAGAPERGRMLVGACRSLAGPSVEN